MRRRGPLFPLPALGHLTRREDYRIQHLHPAWVGAKTEHPLQFLKKSCSKAYTKIATFRSAQIEEYPMLQHSDCDGLQFLRRARVTRHIRPARWSKSNACLTMTSWRSTASSTRHHDSKGSSADHTKPLRN